MVDEYDAWSSKRKFWGGIQQRQKPQAPSPQAPVRYR